MTEKICNACGDNWFEKDSREVTCEECFIQRQIARNNGERPNAKRVFGMPGVEDGAFLMDALDYRLELQGDLVLAGMFENCRAVWWLKLHKSDFPDCDTASNEFKRVVVDYVHKVTVEFLV